MSINVHLYSNLQVHAGGQSNIEVTGDNIGQCLNDLVKKHPGLNKILFEKRKLRSNVLISLNLNSTASEPLDMPVKETDEIYIILIVAGG